ncbi:Hypoxanthine-guanine phosphoribosyltransferase [Bienertia sinuspersici]
MEDDIESVVWSSGQISDRVSELATELNYDFSIESTSSSPVFVGVATGAFVFLSDLVRRISFPISVDLIRVSSYGFGTLSNGNPSISSDLKLDVSAKHVVLVEDIVDTGNTLSRLIEHLKSKGASSISVCTFLDKPSRRKTVVKLVGKGKFYRGFECPGYFVVGYGMDFAERYRNLPYVGVLKPGCYQEVSEELPKKKMHTSI